MEMQCYYVAQVYTPQNIERPQDCNTECRYIAGPFKYYSDAAEARQIEEQNSYNRDAYSFDVVIADIEVIL